MTSKRTAVQRLKQHIQGLVEVNCNVKSKESNRTVYKSLDPHWISSFFSLFAA